LKTQKGRRWGSRACCLDACACSCAREGESRGKGMAGCDCARPRAGERQRDDLERRGGLARARAPSAETAARRRRCVEPSLIKLARARSFHHAPSDQTLSPHLPVVVRRTQLGCQHTPERTVFRCFRNQLLSTPLHTRFQCSPPRSTTAPLRGGPRCAKPHAQYRRAWALRPQRRARSPAARRARPGTPSPSPPPLLPPERPPSSPLPPPRHPRSVLHSTGAPAGTPSPSRPTWTSPRPTPLSSWGRSNGELECPYHGWRWNGAGDCTTVPQALAGTDPASSPRACATAFPCRAAQGIVFVKPQALSKAPSGSGTDNNDNNRHYRRCRSSRSSSATASALGWARARRSSATRGATCRSTTPPR